MEYGKNESVIVLWIWIGIGLALLVTGFITVLVLRYVRHVRKNKRKAFLLIHKMQTEYGENALYLQERDRERLAGELHDNIISRLNMIRLNAQYQDMRKLNLDLKNSMRVIREMSHHLTPPDLSETGPEELISDYLEQVKGNIGVKYYPLLHTPSRISDPVKLNLFRILQELINNALKHADASVITVSLRISECYLVLTVADNGKGLIRGYDKAASGIGLQNIRLRAEQIKARYRFRSKPQRGTRFTMIAHLKQH